MRNARRVRHSEGAGSAELIDDAVVPETARVVAIRFESYQRVCEVPVLLDEPSSVAPSYGNRSHERLSS